MVIADPLYGEFDLPDRLARLVLTPEVRRLSQIRLLNTLSPSLATLGELRRYSHTLGVLYLCMRNGVAGYSDEERDALAASVLLHDIGTPPFGHLLEYHLKESSAWSHEAVIESVLSGTHVPENKAHQIFGLRTIEFQSALRRTGISLQLVRSIVTNKHPLSGLLFGTLDLDNLDNVARMSFSLGRGGGAELAVFLGSRLAVDRESRLCLSMSECARSVRAWSRLRRSVYDVIAFDPPTLAAQAVLSEAIGIAIREQEVTEFEWCLTDEDLIGLLLRGGSTKELISRYYLGRLMPMALGVRLAGCLGDYGLRGRVEAKSVLESALREAFPGRRVLGYVFVDRGTFEKRLSFFDPAAHQAWEVGEASRSVIFYGFVRSGAPVTVARCRRAAGVLARLLRASPAQVRDLRLGPVAERVDDRQRALALTSS